MCSEFQRCHWATLSDANLSQMLHARAVLHLIHAKNTSAARCWSMKSLELWTHHYLIPLPGSDNQTSLEEKPNILGKHFMEHTYLTSSSYEVSKHIQIHHDIRWSLKKLQIHPFSDDSTYRTKYMQLIFIEAKIAGFTLKILTSYYFNCIIW